MFWLSVLVKVVFRFSSLILYALLAFRFQGQM